MGHDAGEIQQPEAQITAYQDRTQENRLRPAFFAPGFYVKVRRDFYIETQDTLCT